MFFPRGIFHATINLKVAKFEFPDCDDFLINDDGYSVQVTRNEVGNSFMITPIDYCNNPADIMPLAIENKITLSPVSWPLKDVGKWMASSDLDAVGEFEDIEAVHTNPYRALAVCYLKMWEAK